MSVGSILVPPAAAAKVTAHLKESVFIVEQSHHELLVQIQSNSIHVA